MDSYEKLEEGTPDGDAPVDVEGGESRPGQGQPVPEVNGQAKKLTLNSLRLVDGTSFLEDDPLGKANGDRAAWESTELVFVPHRADQFGLGASSSDADILSDGGQLPKASPHSAWEPKVQDTGSPPSDSGQGDAHLTSPLGGNDKSPLLMQAQTSSIPELSHKKAAAPVKQTDKVPLLLPSPVKTISSSEDDSALMNVSDDVDPVRSPEAVSDTEADNLGVCSKYSQLSEDGSSPSSPAKSAGLDGHDAGSGQRVVFQHSLELGVAFTEMVDVESFRLSLGTKAPHTEDVLGGKSEEHLLVLLRQGSHKNIKAYLRQAQWPAESDARRRLWENVCTVLLKAGGDLYQEVGEELYTNVDEADVHLPEFVDQEHLHTRYLNPQGVKAAQRVVRVIGHMSPDIVCCPLLFPLASVFLHYSEPGACFNCMLALLSSSDPVFIRQNKLSADASRLVLRDLARKYTKSAFNLLSRSGGLVESVLDDWTWWIFRDLPFHYLVGIVDSFLIEGYKVLYRIVLAILVLFAKDQGKREKRNVEHQDVGAAIANFCATIPYPPKKLLKVGFGIRGLTRKEILKLQAKHESFLKNQPVSEELSSRPSFPNGHKTTMIRPVSSAVLVEHPGTSIMSQDMLNAVWSWIPRRQTLKKLSLLFTSEEHGTNLRTLYLKAEDFPQSLLVIRTCSEEVFGAYCSASWSERHEKNKPNTSFFGNGETFIFALQPSLRKYPWVGLLDLPSCERPSDLFMAGDDSMLVVGSGQGEAIRLDGMMMHCRSEHCDTFANEPLSAALDFCCQVVEVYGFVD